MDGELFDKVRFHNVTAPVLVLPLWPVKHPILSSSIERSRPCLPLDQDSLPDVWNLLDAFVQLFQSTHVSLIDQSHSKKRISTFYLKTRLPKAEVKGD